MDMAVCTNNNHDIDSCLMDQVQNYEPHSHPLYHVGAVTFMTMKEFFKMLIWNQNFLVWVTDFFFHSFFPCYLIIED